MAVYSGMGSAMFASGPQLARERRSGWMRQLRISPISTRGWFAAKLAQAILMIIPGLAVLIVLALTYGHVHLAAGRLGLLVAVLVLGAIPFCALGLVIGLMFDSQTAQVAQMITLLVLAFLGGIFISVEQPAARHAADREDAAQLPPRAARLERGGRPRRWAWRTSPCSPPGPPGSAAVALWRWRSESTVG